MFDIKNVPGIPKIIHLTFDRRRMPNVYRKCLDQLRRLHPKWSFVIYNDEAARRLIEQHMEALLEVYDAYAFNIQRIDMFRVVALYVHGGFYMDMDLFCEKPLDSLCSFQMVLGEELVLSDKECMRLGHRYRQRIANYMFGSVQGHPFWLGLLKVMVLKSQTPVLNERDILENTGPGLLTDFYHDNKENYRNITLLQNQDRICQRKWCQRVSCHFGDFGIHLHTGTWRWGLMRKVLSVFRRRPGARAAVEKAIFQLSGLQVHEENGSSQDLIVLETYDQQQGFCDGLSAVYGRAKAVGKAMVNTRDISNRKVLVCGIPMLYEQKISVRNTNIIYTTFESDRLPSFWVNSINRYYDYCLVPHDEIRAVFHRSGVDIPISVIHQGFTRYKRQWDQAPAGEVFSVGFLGVPVTRKNLAKLYRACKRLQEEHIPTIKLVVHIPFYYEWMKRAAFEEMESDGTVTWSVGKYDSDQMSAWYNSLSCYIFPSSGEGWSFTPRESLYLGVPTILSNIPVHKELAESGFCKVIEGDGREKANFNGSFYGEWRLITEQDIFNSILDVYGNWERYKMRALRGAEWITDKWYNEDVQNQLLKFIQSL